VLVVFGLLAVTFAIPAVVLTPYLGDIQTIGKYGFGLTGFAGERRYLVLAVDPAELRPAGGYTGTVGIVGINNGRIVERNFDDVYLYDTKPGLTYVQPPDALANHLLGDASWQIADAAWSPDFPTAAQDTLRLYELESGDTRIDGVVALTTYAIDRLLEVTGPISVPEYGVIVNPGDTTMIALGMTRGVSTQTSNRKAFLDDLARDIMGRLGSISPLDTPKIKAAFEEIRDRRDAMVWLKDPAAEAWFADSPFGGGVGQQPGDFVYVVEANIEPPSKYNLIVSRADALSVSLDANGTASDVLALNWQNFAGESGPLFDLIRSYSTNQAGLYGAYVRVLTPATSRLETVSGMATDQIEEVEESSVAANRNVFGNYLLMAPGPSNLSYAWAVPEAASQTSGVWTYQLTIQRQSGTNVFPVTVNVALPAGAYNVSATAGSVNGETVSLSANLDHDISLEVSYRLP